MTTQNPAKRPRALIAMSGGVDSSVAACLMQQAGYDCTGITMRLTHNETLGQPGYQTCCSPGWAWSSACCSFCCTERGPLTAPFGSDAVRFSPGGSPEPV